MMFLDVRDKSDQFVAASCLLYLPGDAVELA